MLVGDVVRVTRLERPAAGDRSAFLDRAGRLTQRLNVPWTPELGALWRVRFDDRTEEVFSESELGVIGPDGAPYPAETEVLKETWGDAPREASVPFRPLGAGLRAAPAIMAFLVFCVAGVLLVWAGLASDDIRIGAAGGLLILIGVGSAAVLVS